MTRQRHRLTPGACSHKAVDPSPGSKRSGLNGGNVAQRHTAPPACSLGPASRHRHRTSRVDDVDIARRPASQHARATRSSHARPGVLIASVRRTRTAAATRSRTWRSDASMACDQASCSRSMAVRPPGSRTATRQQARAHGVGRCHVPSASGGSVRSAPWSVGSQRSRETTSVTGSPCWIAITANTSGTVHRCGPPRGSSTTMPASSVSVRPWHVRCAIGARFPPTSWSFGRRRPGTRAPCRTRCAELTEWRAGPGVVYESIRGVCASSHRRHL